MKKKFTIIYFALAFLSCRQHNKPNLLVFTEYELGLRNSNARLSSFNLQLEKSFESYLTNPVTAKFAKAWQPKTEIIKTQTLKSITFIDSIIRNLKENAGHSKKGDFEKYREDDMDAVEKVLFEEGVADKISKSMYEYKNSVLKIDSGMTKEFNSKLDSSFKFLEPSSKGKTSFGYVYFKNVPTVGAVGILERIKNLILNTEFDLLKYCNDQIAF